MSAYHSDYCSTAQNSSHNIPTYQVLSMEGSVASRGKKTLKMTHTAILELQNQKLRHFRISSIRNSSSKTDKKPATFAKPH